MPYRWTIKELKEIDDIDFAIAVLEERRGTLTNPYAPLWQRIGEAKSGLENFRENGIKNCAAIRLDLLPPFAEWLKTNPSQ